MLKIMQGTVVGLLRSLLTPARTAAAMAGGGKADLQDQANRRPPAEWLAEIAGLRRQGRNAEAEASLAEFRRYSPDEPLDNAAEPPR